MSASSGASEVAQGRVYSVSIAGTALNLVADESFSFDAGENTSSFDLASDTTTQTLPGNSDPTIEFELHVETANKEGLTALGIIGSDGSYQFDSGSREMDTVTVEVLDAEAGTVEITHEFNNVLFELGSVEDSGPVTVDVTGYVNGDVTLATGLGTK